MPCFTRQETQLRSVLEKKFDMDMLNSALEAMGYSVKIAGKQLSFYGVNKETGQQHTGSYVDGKLTATGYTEFKLEKVSQSYAVQMVMKKAAPWQKRGWKLQQEARRTA